MAGMVTKCCAFGLALMGLARAEELLTSVSTPTYALLSGTKAVYQDFTKTKSSITEIDINTKVKRVLLPEAGAAPYYIDYGFEGTQLAYVPFTAATLYPLYHMDVDSKVKASVTSDEGWKESVWLGGGVVVWVDFRHKLSTDKNGEIYMRDLSAGGEERLTTDVGYEAKPVTDGKHIVWMDYSAGSYANLVLYDIAAKTSIKPSPTTSHQDNPRVQGDWVVWQDYRNAITDTNNADIYAYNIKTQQVKAICTHAAYQGKPFLQGQGIVWEDYRNTGTNKDNVDIYGYDLAKDQEVAISTKDGYESSPVLYQDRITWFATNGSQMDIYTSTLSFNASSAAIHPMLAQARPAGMADRLFQVDGRSVPVHETGSAWKTAARFLVPATFSMP